MNNEKNIKTSKKPVAKVIAIVLAFALMIATSFVVSTLVHNHNSAQSVSKLKNGLSAYELAVENGYNGSVQEWLTSLDGKSAYDIAVENGYSGSEKDWANSLKSNSKQEQSDIKTAYFDENGELIIKLSDGTSIDVGSVAGTDGKNGTNGKDGKDGKNGKNGKDGKNGIDGKDGINGADGSNGSNGKDGVNGIDGRGIAKTKLVNGELIITYTDGTQENIGGITSNNTDNKYLKFTEIVGKGEYEVGIKDEYRSSIQYVTVPAIYNGKLVTELADRAFSNCVRLESVSLPNTIKKIKKDSFGDCPIKKMVIPEGVEEIEEDAFTFSALEEIYLPDSLTVIPRDCFNHSVDLKKVILPSNLVKIEEFAFYYCPSLKRITLPDTLKEIGFFAFGMCTSLRDLTIPKSVNKIGNGLVIYNSKIKVTFEDTIGWQKRYAELPQSAGDGLHNVVDNYYGDWEDIDPSVMADSNELKKLLESSYEDSNGKEYCYEFQKV